MFNLNQINEHEQKKAQQPVVSKVPDIEKPMVDNDTQELAETFRQKAESAHIKPMPTLQHIDPEEMAKSQRQQYVQQYGTWAEAQKRGDISEQEWANGQIALMKSRGENVGDYVNLLALMGNSETPEQIAKRERREALGETFRGLGNLIGNAANLYYANKSGYSMDLNSINEKHRERAQQLKDKQDALKRQRDEMLLKYKIGDAQRERANEALKEEREYKEKMTEKQYEQQNKRDAFKAEKDLAKLEIQDKLKRGIIDLQTAKQLLILAEKAKDATQLESLRQVGRENLKNIPTGGYQVGESAYGSDGTIYTRSKKLSQKEAKEIAQAHVPSHELSAFETTDADGNVKTDWEAAAAYATQKGYVSNEELESRGYTVINKPSTKGSKKPVSLLPNTKTNLLP